MNIKRIINFLILFEFAFNSYEIETTDISKPLL